MNWLKKLNRFLLDEANYKLLRLSNSKNFESCNVLFALLQWNENLLELEMKELNKSHG